MASGDTLFILDPLGSSPPATLYATIDTISDASTPLMVIPVLDFDGVTSEHADWYLTIPSHYAGITGFTFSYKYATDGSDADLVDIEFRVLKLADLDILTGDLGIDTQTAVSIQDTPPATPTNKLSVSTTGALAKANFGSAVAGDRIIIRATRDVAAAAKTSEVHVMFNTLSPPTGVWIEVIVEPVNAGIQPFARALPAETVVAGPTPNKVGHPVCVDPIQFLRIEDSTLFSNLLQRKMSDQLVTRKNFLITM